VNGDDGLQAAGRIVAENYPLMGVEFAMIEQRHDQRSPEPPSHGVGEPSRHQPSFNMGLIIFAAQ
jgi:hypothetical protein